MKIRKLALLAATTGALACGGVAAAPITFDFSGGGNLYNSQGNVLTYTVDGVTATVTSWGRTSGSSNTTFAAAATGQWSPGLGICDADEGFGSSCNTTSEHYADNSSRLEFFLIQFSAPVSLTSANVWVPSGKDGDVSFGAADLAALYSLAGMNIGGVQAAFGGLTGLDTAAGTRDIDLGGLTFNSLLIGAAYPNPGEQKVETYTYNGACIEWYTYGDKKGQCKKYERLTGTRTVTVDPLDDFFKLASVTVESSKDVPLPGTLALLGLGLAGFGIARRRAVQM